MINLAIIGVGRHSRLHHGPAIRKLRDRLRHVVVADLNIRAAEEYAADFGLDRCYGDVDEMLCAERPDGIIAVTPEAVTAEMFCKLLPRRLPLLMEKPFGETLAETGRLCRLASQERARVMLSLNRRYAPVCRKIRELLNGPLAGRPVRHVRGAMFRQSRFDSNFIRATAIHLIDMVNCFGGAPGQVVSVQASRREAGSAPAVSALLSFPSGATGELLVDSDSGFIAECYELTGRDFRIEADYFRGYTLYEGGKITGKFELDARLPLEEREGADVELATFIDGVEQAAATFPTGPEDALAAARIADAMAQVAGEKEK